MSQNGLAFSRPNRGAGTTIIFNGTLTDDVTFTSADARNLFDSDGLLDIDGAPAETARRSYPESDVPTFWADGGVTEISGRGGDLDNWSGGSATVAKNAVGIDGQANTGWTLTDSDAGTSIFLANNTTVTSSTNKHIVGYAVAEDATPSVYPLLRMSLLGGTALTHSIVLDPSDGTFNTFNSDGEVLVDPILIDGFWYCFLALTDNGTGNTTLQQRLDPAFNTNGSGAADASATGSTVFGYCGAFTTNPGFHPMLTTGGTTETLDAEDASLTLGSWYPQTGGTWFFEFFSPSNFNNHPIFEVKTDTSNRYSLDIVTSGGNSYRVTGDGFGGAGINDLASQGPSLNSVEKVALVITDGDIRLHRNGSKILDVTDAGSLPAVDTLNVGKNQSGQYLYGGIHDAKFTSEIWSEAEANSRTS